ncbi:MAG: hypothetical protein LBJ00_11880 [Planctomycetaceae bacterium]|nr:hypothetical protein [Planctomycetaceae bacterium]
MFKIIYYVKANLNFLIPNTQPQRHETAIQERGLLFVQALEYYFVVVIMLFSVLAMVGCSCRRLPPPPEGLPELHPCKITVTFGGQAFEGINVSLASVDPKNKWKAGGRTDQNGVAEIRTSFAFVGAPLGQFKVGFDKIREEATENSNAVIYISSIPLKYGRNKTTEIIEIKKGKNEFNFNYDNGEERIVH